MTSVTRTPHGSSLAVQTFKSVMERMGHSRIQTTQKHLHALPEANQKKLDALDRIAAGRS